MFIPKFARRMPGCKILVLPQEVPLTRSELLGFPWRLVPPRREILLRTHRFGGFLRLMKNEDWQGGRRIAAFVPQGRDRIKTKKIFFGGDFQTPLKFNIFFPGGKGNYSKKADRCIGGSPKTAGVFGETSAKNNLTF
jgi:hypothetical protein